MPTTLQSGSVRPQQRLRHGPSDMLVVKSCQTHSLTGEEVEMLSCGYRAATVHM